MDDYLLHYKLSLTHFVHCYSRLASLQVHQGWFNFDNLVDFLTKSPSLGSISTFESNIYINLIMEALSLSSVRPGCFSMPIEVLRNEKIYLQNILYILENKFPGLNSPALEEFYREVVNYINVKGQYPSSPPMSTSVMPRMENKQSSAPSLSPTSGSSHNSRSTSGMLSRTSSSGTSAADHSHISDLAKKSSNTEIKPVKYFLMLIRQNSMDILFPASLQDKAMMCIYLALHSYIALSHNQLINIALHLKDYKLINKNERVSKTKLRGVISLMKAAGILVVKRNESDQALIHLCDELNNFQDIRFKHDEYIMQFINENYLDIGKEMLTDIIWQIPEDMKKKRLEVLDQSKQKIVSMLESLPPALITSGYQVKKDKDNLGSGDDDDNDDDGSESLSMGTSLATTDCHSTPDTISKLSPTDSFSSRSPSFSQVQNISPPPEISSFRAKFGRSNPDGMVSVKRNGMDQDFFCGSSPPLPLSRQMPLYPLNTNSLPQPPNLTFPNNSAKINPHGSTHYQARSGNSSLVAQQGSSNPLTYPRNTSQQMSNPDSRYQSFPSQSYPPYELTRNNNPQMKERNDFYSRNEGLSLYNNYNNNNGRPQDMPRDWNPSSFTQPSNSYPTPRPQNYHNNNSTQLYQNESNQYSRNIHQFELSNKLDNLSFLSDAERSFPISSNLDGSQGRKSTMSDSNSRTSFTNSSTSQSSLRSASLVNSRPNPFDSNNDLNYFDFLSPDFPLQSNENKSNQHHFNLNLRF